MIVLPWHLSEPLSEGLNVTLPPSARILDAAPRPSDNPWTALIPLYEPVAAAVAAADAPRVVLSGDCVTALAVAAGVQRRGISAGLVWFDAHGDFHTESSTASGYLGGLPLAKAVGRGDLTLPKAMGLTSLPEDQVLLVDARDLDPPEVEALNNSAVRRAFVSNVSAALHSGPLHLHIDIDVVDPTLIPGLRFPAPGGPDVEALATALKRIVEGHNIAVVSIAATYRPASSDRVRNDAVLGAILAAIAD